MNGEEIIAFLKDIKPVLEKYGVKRIGLFGSYSKNQAQEDSDIDVLVEFVEGNKNFDNYMDLKFYLEDKLKKEVDLVIKSSIKEELKSKILGSVRFAVEEQ